jgi:hypothetical protein
MTALPKGKLNEESCHEALKARGLLLRVNRPPAGGEHWLIDSEAGRRILDYWPRRGRWWCAALGKKGVERDEAGLVELAVKLAIEMRA